MNNTEDIAHMTEREVDTKAEKIVGEFLDKNLYERIRATTGVNFERIHDRKRQLEGIDVLTKGNNGYIYIDEKVQLDYINRNLPTNCFEISFLNRYSTERTGWFVNDELKTNYYLIVWPFASLPCHDKDYIPSKKDLTYVNITELQCLLISKDKIKQYLEKQGFTKEKMMEISHELRETKQRRMRVPNKDFYFTYTETKAEKPTNVIIRKEVLLLLASHVYSVTKDSLTILTKPDIQHQIEYLQSTRRY